ncbi:MAG: metal-dependent phosphohydrolase, partial [Desulfobacteraceae bacterium]|nr:metal-dependent phosphohydrolase [Desulfobacteraceae bacterium]
DYEAKLRRLREREMLEEEARKRVEARTMLRDQGMSHCFDTDLLKRFIVTINKSESFDLSGLL